MTPLTELEARHILAEDKSQAASGDLFRAQRLDSGWVFRWANGSGQAPFGVRPWVVTDGGKADMVDLRESALKALERLSH